MNLLRLLAVLAVACFSGEALGASWAFDPKEHSKRERPDWYLWLVDPINDNFRFHSSFDRPPAVRGSYWSFHSYNGYLEAPLRLGSEPAAVAIQLVAHDYFEGIEYWSFSPIGIGSSFKTLALRFRLLPLRTRVAAPDRLSLLLLGNDWKKFLTLY